MCRYMSVSANLKKNNYKFKLRDGALSFDVQYSSLFIHDNLKSANKWDIPWN